MLKLFKVSQFEKVFMHKEPCSECKKLFLFKNETAAFQLVINYDIQSWKTKIEIESDFPKELIKAYRVRNIICENSIPSDADDYILHEVNGYCPDLLEDFNLNKFCIPIDCNMSIYFKFLWNEKLKDREYKVKFDVKLNEEIKTEEVTITNTNIILPEKPMKYTNWIHYDSFINLHKVKLFSNEFYYIFEKYIKLAVYSGVNTLMIPTHTPPLDTEIGGIRKTAQLIDIKFSESKGYEFSFEKLNKFIDFVLERGIKYLEIPPLFTQWGAKFCPLFLINMNGKNKKMFGWKSKNDDSNYKIFLNSYISSLHKFLAEKGLENECFYHISDEPKVADLEKYIQCKDFVKKLIGNSKIIDAVSHLEFYNNDGSLLVCSIETIDKFIEKKVEPLCGYYCLDPHNNYFPNRLFYMPLDRLADLGVLSYLNGLKLLLHWGFNFYGSGLSKTVINPYICSDSAGMFPPGDSFIVYPDVINKGVYSSLRLESIYEGFKLYRILMAIEEKKGKNYVYNLLSEFGFKCFNGYPHGLQIFQRFYNVLIDELIL